MNIQEAYSDENLGIFNSNPISDLIFTITSQAFERGMAFVGGTLTLIGTATGNNKLVYAGGAITLIAPLLAIAQIKKMRDKIVEFYNLTWDNKKEFSSLLDRIGTIESALKPLWRKKQENEKNFRQQEYYLGFGKLEITIRKLKKFMAETSRLSGYKKFLHASWIKEEQGILNKELDYDIRDLNFALTIDSEKNRMETSDVLDETIAELQNRITSLESQFAFAATQNQN